MSPFNVPAIRHLDNFLTGPLAGSTLRLHTLEQMLQTGSLTLRGPGKRCLQFGCGEPKAEIHLQRHGTLPRILLNPALAFGETYMEGDWQPGEGGLLRVFEVLARNQLISDHSHPAAAPLRWLRRLGEFNSAHSSRRNVQHHYDLDAALYRQFLDADLQYSCAYFGKADFTLEQAQRAKCQHIASKLLLKPGDRVLDIGSGWGGLALFLAREYGIKVTGLTLSKQQLQVSRQRARAAKLERQIRFVGEDYRAHQGRYDAIVSVGMFEHVGRPQYPRFFAQLARLLKPDGRSLVHTIGRTGPPTTANPWINRYIFPGAYIPALSEVMRAIEPMPLKLTDCEVWRLHYAETLKHWHSRFQSHRVQFRRQLGEHFCRMWEFYLQSSEAMFRWGELVVYQLQLAPKHDAVPLTRDYLYPTAPSMLRAPGKEKVLRFSSPRH